MGHEASSPHGKEFICKLKTGEVIKYNLMELKNRDAFSPEPSEEDILSHLLRCLQETTLSVSQKAKIMKWPTKYKHRFAQKHDAMVQSFRKSAFVPVDRPHQKTIEKALQDKLTTIQTSTDSLKQPISQLDNYLYQHHCYEEVFRIDCITRLLKVLQREEKKNRLNLKYSFSNQIDIMKFLRKLQTRNNDMYMEAVTKIPNYLHSLMYNLHPINIACTVSVIDMIVDYIWSCEDSSDALEQLQSYKNQRVENRYAWLLQPFTETMLMTDNALVIYYIVKCINELYSSLIDNSKLEWFRKQLRDNNYHLVLDIIKKKIQNGSYILESCTFQYIHSKMFEYKAKARSQTISENDLLEMSQALSKAAQNHQVTKEEDLSEEPDDEFDIYLTMNNYKLFKNYLSNALTQIEIYQRIESNINDERMHRMESKERQIVEAFQLAKNRCKDMSVLDALWRITDNLQYIDKQGWKTVDHFIQRTCGQNTQIGPINTEKDKVAQVLRGDLEIKQAQLNMVLLQNQSLKKQLKLISQDKKLFDHNRPIKELKSKSLVPEVKSIQTSPEVVKDTVLQPPPPSTLPQQVKVLPAPPPLPTLTKYNQSSISSEILPPPPLPPTNTTSIQVQPQTKGTISASTPLPPPPPISGLSFQDFGKEIPLTESLIIPPPPLTLSKCSSIIVEDVNSPFYKPKQKPSVPLKGCLIDVISPTKIQGTVWKDIDDTKVPINKQQLQRLFAKSSTMQFKIQRTSMPIEKPTTFLDSNRARNIQIVLVKLRLPLQSICNILFTANRKCLSVLENVENILPTPEEQQNAQALMEFEQLCQPEKFVYMMSQIPRFRERTQALLFIWNYKDKVQLLHTKQEKLTESFKEVKDSPRFRKILEVALAIVNYLNGQTFRGGAWGFKIKSLLNMADTKSNDGFHTAATEMVAIVMKTYLPIFDPTQIEHIQVITKSSVLQCKEECTWLREQLKKVIVAAQSQTDNPGDKISSVCSPVISDVTKELQTLDGKQNLLQEKYRQCAEFYCESGFQKSEEFGKVIVDCMTFVVKTEEEIRKREESQKQEGARKSESRAFVYRRSNDMNLVNQQIETQSSPFMSALGANALTRRQNIYNRLKNGRK